MKREVFIPIVLGFLSKTMPFWCAEEDTPEGHIKNFVKGVSDHPKVLQEILEKHDGENIRVEHHKPDHGEWP